MQTILKSLIFASLVICNVAAAAATEKGPAASHLLSRQTVPADTIQTAGDSVKACANTPAAEKHSHLYNIGRGITNIATCWLEVPRCMVYRNSQVPFWGFVAGSIEGVGTTAMRAFAGVTDVLFLGYDYGLVYDNQFGDFIWDARWQPKPDASL
ncbi:hypothetical protein P0136_01470 [Lentisphaerota bacterium ZTH]|nr:hypothetical protein JYG24_07390 [Lentisphaerota bacterium]WET06683.1 hypothetical protein P0136_01470 [Lentisphaerota bacterium ZTH]